MSGSHAFLVSMIPMMARVRERTGLTRYRSLRILLTSTGGISKRVLDRPLQASLYSRSAVSNAMADAIFIEPSSLGIVMPSSTDFAMSAFEARQHQDEQRSA